MSINHRQDTRTAVALEAAIHIDGNTHSCRVKDISLNGAKLICELTALKGSAVSLLLDPFGSVLGEVAWNNEDTTGIKFNDDAEVVETILIGLSSYAMV